jgi:hypothetical protein
VSTQTTSLEHVLKCLLKCLAGLSTLEISDQTLLTRRAKGGPKADHEFDHRHRFDEFESSDEEEDEEDGDGEEIDAGVSGRGGASGSSSGEKKKSSSSSSSSAHLEPTHPDAIFTGPISELRSSIEFKYHVILIYKQLVEMDENAAALAAVNEAAQSGVPLQPKDPAVEPDTAAAGAAGSPAAASTPTQHLFPSWQDLESSCNSNLTRVVISLIQHQLVDIASKLYVLYKTYSKLYPPPSARRLLNAPTPEELDREQYHKAQEALIDQHLTNQLEAASLAALLSASSPTSDRIFAIKRLQTLPRARIYPVGEGVLSYLDSSHSRYVIAQLLAQFLATQHKAAGGGDSGPSETQPSSIAAPPTPSLDSYLGGSSSGSASSQHQVVATSMTGGLSSTGARSLADSSQPAPPTRRFYSTLSLEKERWFLQVHHATKLLVCLPEDLQHRYGQLYSDPLAILTELLKHGHHLHLRKIFPIFKEYCAITGQPDDAFFFILNFASRLLTLGLEELSLDKAQWTDTCAMLFLQNNHGRREAEQLSCRQHRAHQDRVACCSSRPAQHRRLQLA